jgi:thiamine-phosphate pyrophosphorylase
LPEALPPLHAIVDAGVAAQAGWDAGTLALALLEGGARFIQLRGKDLPSDRFLALCDYVVGAAASRGALVIVNDRVDLALVSGASGVHVGQEDLTPADARRLLGSQAIIGLSTHTVSQIDMALGEPIDYIAVGPVFGTRTKDTGYLAVGLDLVSAAARRAGGLPVVAIGGITLENAQSVIDAGAASVAVISDLLVTGDAAGRTRAYLQSLMSHRV